MNGKEFNYSYSAPTEAERNTIESIRKQYAPTEIKEERIKRLKSLDNRVREGAMIAGLTLGIIGTLIFGLGLSMVLEWSMFIGGVAVAVVGLLPVAAAYPAYNYFLGRGKKKYGAEILKLTDELLNESGEG